MEGLKQLVSDQEYRKEIVANGLGSYLSCRAFVDSIFLRSPFIVTSLDFLELGRRLGNRAGEFWSRFLIHQRKINNTTYLLKWFAGELPEVNHQLVYMATLFTVSQDCSYINSNLGPRQPSYGPRCVYSCSIDGQESSFEFELHFSTNWWPGEPVI